jgi:hypothetical protein
MTPPANAGTELWSSAEWREVAIAWLDAELQAVGRERTGPVEQPHLRPWATALRAPTTQGKVWLKAASRGTAFEIQLYPLLQRVVPHWVLAPIAVDLERNWILLPDGGEALGQSIPEADLVPALALVLPQYAHLQRELTPHAEEMLALGLSDMRAAVLPERFEEALVVANEYVCKHGNTADRELHERVQQFRGTFSSWCRELAAAPVSPSLDHNDLHPWNIFVQRSEAGRLDARFYDWGDSVLAHPFASLLVPLGQIRQRRRLNADHPELLRLRDAYLEVFSDLAPAAELIETLELACRASKAARALTWARALQALSDPEARDLARAPLRWLGYLLDDEYLGIGG